VHGNLGCGVKRSINADGDWHKLLKAARQRFNQPIKIINALSTLYSHFSQESNQAT